MNLDALTPMLSEPRQVPTEGKVTYHEPMIEREPRQAATDHTGSDGSAT